METINHEIERLKMNKFFAWLITIVLMIAGLPIFKNAIVLILEKLYQLFIQNATGK